MQPDFLVDFPGLGIFDLPVSRVAFQLFGWPVYWYGLLIATAIILCMLLAMKQAPQAGLTSDDIMDTFIAIIPLMIIFARLYYVVFEWDYYASDLTRIFSTRDGGLAFYGGIIGGILAIAIVTRIKKIKVVSLLDFLAVYVPLGQAIGRWGNFFNQEAFGNNTTLPWGMYSNQTEAYLKSVTRIAGLDPSLPVHPTFFYEFAGNMLIFWFLMRLRRKARFPMQIMLWYLLLYGVLRYFVEGIRTDPLMIPGTTLRVSMILSALMVLASAILLIFLSRRQQHRELTAALYDPGSRPAVPEAEVFAPDDTSGDFIAVDDEETGDKQESQARVGTLVSESEPGRDLPAGNAPEELTGHPDDQPAEPAADEETEEGTTQT